MANAGHSVAVVFVHGLFGSEETWSPLVAWLRQDPYFQTHAEVLAFSFESPKRTCFALRQIPRLATLANKLRTYLLAQHLERYEHVVLVGHSLGGLVIQKFLVDFERDLQGPLRGVRRMVLVATPNNGSEFLLSSRRWMGAFFRHPHERLTRPFNQEIEELQGAMVRRYGAPIGTSGQELTFRALVGSSDGIVTVGSARGMFQDVYVVPGDHNSILRPSGADAQICTSIVNEVRLCRECLPPHCINLSIRSVDPKTESPEVARLVRELFPPHAHFDHGDLQVASEYYATRGPLQVRVLGALVNTQLVGFSLFTETPSAIVIGYIGVTKSALVTGPLRLALFAALVDQIRARASELGRPVLFEVKRPTRASRSCKEERARVRLFEKHGARVIAGIDYRAPNMARIGEVGAEEAYLMMYGRDGAMPEHLDREEVHALLAHLYLVAYQHWFAPTLGEEKVAAYLRQLTSDVMLTVNAPKCALAKFVHS